MSKIISVIRALLLVILALLYRLATLPIPKKKNLWIFGSWKGKNFSDNSRTLFEYVQKNHPEIESVWISKNEKVLSEVRALGYKTIDYRTLYGKLFVTRAMVSIQTESNEDTGKFKISRTKIIQLWHGIGDAKTIYSSMNPIKKWIVEIYSETHQKSLWMTSSEHQKDNIHEYFKTPLKNIYVTGTPRTDAILERKKHDYFESLKNQYCNAKLIAYMPTHRKFGENQYNILEQSELEMVNNFLRTNNMLLLIKPHPLEAYKYKNKNTQYSNIIILLGEVFSNTQAYLHYFDALISDYSSVSYDYLCLNRPIILFTYDFQEFKKTDMGLRDDYIEVSPGPHCTTWEEVCYELSNAFTKDNYREKREKLIPRYYKYTDDHNCERVFEQIIKICY